MSAGVRHGLGASLAGLLLSAFLLASPAAHAADECGTAPSGGGDIFCDGDDQTAAAGGIEYQFGDNNQADDNNYTIKVKAADSDGDTLDIDTTADNTSGVFGEHGSTGNLTIEMSAGDIETTGEFADGVHGRHDGTGEHHISITMSGGIIKTGTGSGTDTGRFALGLYGETASNNSGSLSISMSDGTIQTGFGTGTGVGYGAAGIYAKKDGTGMSTVTMSGGSIHTKGQFGYGVYSLAKSSTSTVTMSGGSILTEGAKAYGFYGLAQYSGSTTISLTDDIPGGTCDGTTNTGCDIHTKNSEAHGIFGTANYIKQGRFTVHVPTGTVDIEMAGGDILTEGADAVGIFGRHQGSNNISIALSGGSILTEGADAYGIYGFAEKNTVLRTPLPPETITPSGNVSITMTGGSIMTTGTDAHGIYGEHEGTGKLTVTMTGSSITTSGSGARGIYAQHEGTGAFDPVVVENSTISAAQAEAIYLDATPAKTLTLRNSTIERGNTGDAIWFSGDTDDTLTVLGHKDASMTATTTIGGNMAFGGNTTNGTDTLVFSTCRQTDISENTACEGQEVSAGILTLSHTTGRFTGLESIRKIGSGTARLGNLDAGGTDATPSSAMMSLEEGKLILEGHLDLGETAGVLTIHNMSRLIFGAMSETEFGKITANQVKFNNMDWQPLFVADDDALSVLSGKDVLVNESGAFVDSSGTEIPMALTLYSDETGEMVGVVTCDETTYTSGADPGIEYDKFTDANDYTIYFRDHPDDDRSFTVTTTAADDYGLYGKHAGTGNLTHDDAKRRY